MSFPARIWIPFVFFSSLSISDIALAFTALVWLLLILSSGTVPLGSKCVFGALLTPVLVSIFSLVWTIDTTTTLKALVIYTEALLAYLAAIYLLHPIPFERIAKLIVLFVSLVIIGAVFSYIGLPGFSPQLPPDFSSQANEAYLITYKARFSHPFIGLSNNLATILAFFPFILAACYKITRARLYLWTLYATLIAILATFSRGVLLALFIVTAAYLLAQRTRFLSSRMLVKGIISVALGLTLFIMLNPVAAKHLGARFSLTEIYVRMDLYRQTIEAVKSAPFLGYGAGVTLDDIRGSNLSSVHNTYLEHLLNLGILGAIPVVAALLALPILIMNLPVLTSSARLIRKAVALSVTVELLVFMSQPSFEGSLLRMLFYFSIGMGISLLSAANRKPEFRR